MTLLDGKSHKVNASSVNYNGPGRTWVSSHRVADIKVFGSTVSSEKRVTVQTKDGLWYELLPDATGGSFNLHKLYTPNGHYLKFNYSVSNSTLYLSSIVDSEGTTLVNISYDHDLAGNSTPNYSQVGFFSGLPTERVVKLDFNNTEQTLSKIDLQATDSEWLATTFTYEADNLSLLAGGFNTIQSIKTVTHASGAVETLTYDNVIGLPLQSPWSSLLPGVTTYQRKDSNLQTSTTTYELALNGNNFLGTGQQGVVWENATDCLSQLGEAYSYSTKSIEDGGKVTVYTFNKFHQETSKVIHYGDETATLTQTTAYYGRDDISIEDAAQSNLYELPQSKTTLVLDGAETLSLVSSFTFDDWGNLLTQTHPDGRIEEQTFYDSAGENDTANGFVCPAHPFGMHAFMREKISKSADASLSSKSTSTYKIIPNAGDTILEASLIQEDQTTLYTYQGETGAPGEFPGVPFTEIHTYLGHTRTVTFTYEFPVGEYARKITQDFSGSDGTTASSFELVSYLTQHVLEVLEPDGEHQTFSYDKIGRIITNTSGIGSDFESTTSYDYLPLGSLTGEIDYHEDIIAEMGCGWMIREENPATLSYQHTLLDGNRRELRSYIRHAEGSYYKISSLTYDGLGRTLTETAYDYDLSVPGSPITYTDTETTVYGKWGSPVEKVANNGLITTYSLALSSKQVTKQQIRRDDASDTEKVTASRFPERITYNLSGKPTLQEVLDLDGNPVSAVSRSYDGLGRIKGMTNASGNTVGIDTYDVYGRPVSLTHLDATQYTIAYTPTGPQRLPASLTVEPVPEEDRTTPFTIFAQTFDLMDRVISRTVGGSTTHYEYQNGATHPVKSVNAREQTTLFGILPNLGERPSRITTFDQIATIEQWDTLPNLSDDHFIYGSTSNSDAPLGKLSKTNPGAENAFAYTYGDQGMISELNQTTDGHDHVQEIVRQTLMGKVLEVLVKEDDGDRTIVTAYDAHGMLATTLDGDLLIELAQNSFGELETETISQNGTTLQCTSIYYNEKGLEWKRSLDSKLGGSILLIETDYDVENRIETRTTSIDGVEKRAENFSYDDKGRLLSYGHTAGYDAAYLPLNGNGIPFESQTYTYDSIDNIQTLTTVLPDGQVNLATYTHSGQQVTQISNDLTGDGLFPALVTFGYDADGNMTQMGGQTMTYNPFGRMISHGGSAYQFDAFQRLVHSEDGTRVYFQSAPISRIQGGTTTHLVRSGSKTVAERTGEDLLVLGHDLQHSVILNSQDGETEVIAYDSMGAGSGSSLSGYAGGIRDTQSGGYFLGNGIRTYFPVLGNFASQDDFSPFEGGGLNPYAYCNRDPLNAIDPSGHMSEVGKLGTQVGLAIVGVLGSIFGVIAAIPTGGSSLAGSAAIWAGVALGMASLSLVGSALSLTASSMALDDELNDKDRSEDIKILKISSWVISAVTLPFSVGKMGHSAFSKNPKFPRTLGDKFVYEPMKDNAKTVYRAFRTFGLAPSAKKGKARVSNAWRKIRGKEKKVGARTPQPGQLALEYHPSTSSARSSLSGPASRSSSIRNVPEGTQPTHVSQDAPTLNLSSDHSVGRGSLRSLSSHPMDTSELTRNTMHIVDNG